MKKYWISCEKFTVQVNTGDNDIIIETAPIVRAFINQPIINLLKWTKTKWPESFKAELLE